MGNVPISQTLVWVGSLTAGKRVICLGTILSGVAVHSGSFPRIFCSKSSTLDFVDAGVLLQEINSLGMDSISVGFGRSDSITYADFFCDGSGGNRHAVLSLLWRDKKSPSDWPNWPSWFSSLRPDGVLLATSTSRCQTNQCNLSNRQ